MEKLRKLIAQASTAKMSLEEREAQRRSFAYGNTHFENRQITRATIQQAAQRLQRMEAAR